MKESERIAAVKLARAAEVGLAVSPAAGGDGRALKPEQQKALEMLLDGKSIVETARETGVTRQTIHSWLRNDPVFVASYNEWHEEMKDSAQSRMLMLMDRAADAVEKSLEAGDGKLGMRILEKMGAARERAAGSTDVEMLRKEKELAKRRKKLALENAMTDIAMEEWTLR